MAVGDRSMHTERSTRIAAAPDAVWDTLRQVDRYRDWWPWLRSFDARGLEQGDRWTCTVRPPLPYQVTFTIVLEDVVGGEAVAARVEGDVEGEARIDLVPDTDGTDLRLVADLHAATPWLRRLDRWARPVARFGHDRIIDRALADLARRAT